MTIADDTRSKIEKFLTDSQMTKTDLGLLAVGQRNFVHGFLRAETNPTIANIDKLNKFIDDWYQSAERVA